MFYKYNKKKLKFKKINLIGITIAVILFLFLCTSSSILKNEETVAINEDIEKEVIIIINKMNEFSEEKLIKKIQELNFQFPHIVYAQSKLETNNFKSTIFLENNNLFGMKEATQRVHTSIGTQNGFAYYNNWTESLYDYAFYYSTYLYKLTTKNEYYNYLSQFYAEDTAYVSKLKNIIRTEDLENIFN